MQAGPFRIEKPAGVQTHGLSPDDKLKGYMSRLITLIPGEALGAYLTVRGLFTDPGGGVPTIGQAAIFVQYLPVLGLVLVIISRVWGTRNDAGAISSVQWVGTSVAAVAYILWLFAMGHKPLGIELDGRVASSLIVIFSFLVPYFYHGEQ
ncbi:hypothetical protein [Methylobacterium sp. Leaf465]|uniref:hypothetical protein n=1 Tax=Methylobacterium sp. Leaf465 TaxID=1736385 RepID=UPI0012E34FC0|nr:hypothetical protein [Methylobacterium sp. Leaf465]